MLELRPRSGIARALCATAAALGLVPSPGWSKPFVNFETIPTRALELSADGKRLFAANTPDGRLEVFDVTPGGLKAAGSVSVGLEPVAVAARSASEVWVVNLLSDSVSVVDVAQNPPRVTRTILVGDEPRDIVFAGPGRSRAFITAARRGQNHREDVLGELQTPGIGRADVWVFDANDLGTALKAKPLAIVQLFADKPGPLTASRDGKSVFVGIATSGNETTVIDRAAVCRAGGRVTGGEARGGGGGTSMQTDPPCPLPRGGMSPGGIPAPNVNQVDGAANPLLSLIVKFDEASGDWRDGLGRDWRDAVAFQLPDNDVFELDAMANPPVQKQVFRHVGTLNKSLAVDPASGKVFVATIDAMNLNRFLSAPRLGAFPNAAPATGVAPTADPATGKTLNGHLYESRIAILSPDGKVASRHLNKHIDYEVVPSPAGVKEKSVADPQGLLFSPDGQTLFVAALGSNQIVPFRKAALEDDSFQPDASNHIQLSGDGGPTDMVLSADGAKMFVYKRFDNTIATVDVAARKEVAVTPLFDPEPTEVRSGRKFFYDATLTSSNGEANCNVCHPGADKDDLAWDLGSPFAGMKANPDKMVAGFSLAGLGGGAGRAGGAGAGIDPNALAALLGAGGAGGAGAGIDPNALAALLGAGGAGGAGAGLDPNALAALLGAGGTGGAGGAAAGNLPARTDLGTLLGGSQFNPFKGPMAVLTLRGIKDGGPMLWRGDSTNAMDPQDERANFQNLNTLFEALLGRPEPLPQADFDRFTDWVLTVTNPPNPNRPLDNVLNASQEAGRVLFFGETRPVDGPLTCNNCHFTDPSQGFFGTRGEFFPEGQAFKVTGLRPVYDKIGSAGRNNGRAGDPRVKGGARTSAGPQIRGIGTLHDGTMASAEEFLALPVGFALNDAEIAQVADFLAAFPTDFAPVVGQQTTLRTDSGADVLARIDLFQQRAAAPFVMPGNAQVTECDLVAKAVVDGRERGFLFEPASQSFRDDRGQRIASDDLRALARTPGQEVTFTCVYPGGGERFALDRNLDGRLDGQP